MATIIILIIVFIIAILIVPYMRQWAIDKVELTTNPIEKKFEVLVGMINNHLMNGLGEITLFDDDKRAMNLMADCRSNLLVQFYYNAGILTIILNYIILPEGINS